MPQAAPRPCTAARCGVLVRDGSTRCPAHKVQDQSFADSRRGSRHERGYGNAWTKLRNAVMARDGGLCQACKRTGFTTPATQVDHIVNKARGGTDDSTNLQALCNDCHVEKTAAEARTGRHHAPRAPLPATPGGVQIHGAAGQGTDRFVGILRAQVAGVGGVKLEGVSG